MIKKGSPFLNLIIFNFKSKFWDGDKKKTKIRVKNFGLDFDWNRVPEYLIGPPLAEILSFHSYCGIICYAFTNSKYFLK